MQKILIKNIKGLVQAGEEIPLIRKGKDMQELPIIKNAFLEPKLLNFKLCSFFPTKLPPNVVTHRYVLYLKSISVMSCTTI